MAKTYWITGYSGAGKTTIGKELYHIIKQNKDACVFLDGDKMREMYGNDLGYSQEDRFKSAMRYSRLCEFLTSQGIDVICCTISMFNEVRKWNRENISKYVEVYLKVPKETLRKRDQKGFYSAHESGEANNVVGLDLHLEEPENPDIVITNDGSISVAYAAELILKGESYYA
jgi:adenylylsulfate kinase